jgi:excisionase family DNA binding protein
VTSPDDLLSDREAAEYLRVPLGTLRNMATRGEAPPSIKIGKRRLYRRDAVVRWVHAREEQSA